MRMPRVLAVALPCVVVMFMFAACGGDDGGGAAGTAFEATIAGARGVSGKLSVTVETPAAAAIARAADVAGSGTTAANGTLVLVGGGTVPLAGTCNAATGELNLSGGGYTFSCTISGGELNGTYTAPGRAAGYVAGVDSSSGVTRVFCGTYSGTRTVAPHDVHGCFNLVIAPDGKITGLGVDDLGVGGRVTGTLRGNVISALANGRTSISGTLDGDTVSGTFTEPQSSGNWSGTRI